MNAQRALEVLERIKAKQEVVCLYMNARSSSFSLGFVDALSQEYVVLRSLSSHGRPDGWELLSLDEICRIEYGGRYEENVHFLCRARDEKHKIALLDAVPEGADLMREVLLAAKAHDVAISLDTGARKMIDGFIKAVELEFVVLESLNTYGQIDGESTVELQTIEKVIVDDEDLQDLKLLARWHEMEPPNW